MKFPALFASSYTQLKIVSTSLRGQEICFVSKPGLPEWDQISPAAQLLAEQTCFLPADKALLFGCGHAAVAAAIASSLPQGEIWLTDASFLALQLSAKTLAANDITNAHIHAEIDLPVDWAGSFDVVLMDLPKGRKLAQRWLAAAWMALRPGGRLYLAGANQQGVQSIVQDAQTIFGAAVVLAYKKGSRILSFTRSDRELPKNGWHREAGVAPGAWHPIQVETPQGALRLSSLPGVFSYDRLDEGTRLLLAHLHVAPTDRALDLGCGYGVIGLVAALGGAAQVDLVDANLLAVACAARNAAAYTCAAVRCFPSDVLSAVSERRYTLIATNPPFHAGHAVDYLTAEAFIQQSYQALEPGGRLLLVANRFIQYQRLMENLFAGVEILYRDKRYTVFKAST